MCVCVCVYISLYVCALVKSPVEIYTSPSPSVMMYLLIHPEDGGKNILIMTQALNSTLTYSPALLFPPAPLLNFTTMTVMLSGQPR